MKTVHRRKWSSWVATYIP